jgi:hypothetical protein
MYMYNKKKARPGEAEKDIQNGTQNRAGRTKQADQDRKNGTG